MTKEKLLEMFEANGMKELAFTIRGREYRIIPCTVFGNMTADNPMAEFVSPSDITAFLVQDGKRENYKDGVFGIRFTDIQKVIDFMDSEKARSEPRKSPTVAELESVINFPITEEEFGYEG